MLSVDDVLRVIGEKILPLEPVGESLLEGHGKVLAEAVVMQEDSPPFDRAQLDGYAVRSADFHRGGLLEAFAPGLRIIGQRDAGMTGGSAGISPGECIGINTGAMMPEGADAVLMVEYSVRLEGDDVPRVRPTREVAAGYGVQKRASDARAGDKVLQAGVRLAAAELAVAAAAGAATLSVRKLRAGLLTTGDELIPVGATPQPGQIRNSNHLMLAALLRGFGTSDLLDLGSCGDEADRLRELLGRGLSGSDLLLVSGGMSMGTRDLVPGLLQELGVVFYVEKVRMKPGKPLVIGEWEQEGRRCYVAGLPGNPVSGFVCFHRFVREMLVRLLQADEASGIGPRFVEAQCEGALVDNGDREFYLPCRVSLKQGSVRAEPLAWKGSADLFTLSKAQGLIVRPVGAGASEPGAVVPVLLLGGVG